MERSITGDTDRRQNDWLQTDTTDRELSIGGDTDRRHDRPERYTGNGQQAQIQTDGRTTGQTDTDMELSKGGDTDRQHDRPERYTGNGQQAEIQTDDNTTDQRDTQGTVNRQRYRQTAE